MHLTIDPAALLRVAPHVGGADRPVLSGIFCQSDGTLTATNGHSLGTETGAVTWPDGPREGEEGVILALPKGHVAMARKARKQGDLLTVTIDGTRATWQGAAIAPVIDGPYPNWRHVMPPTDPGTVVPARLDAVAFDPDVVALFGSVSNNVTLTPWPSGDPAKRAWTVTAKAAPNFTGLLMPCRITTPQPEPEA